MIYNIFTNKWIYTVICGLFGLCALAGCSSPQEHKAEADEKVYEIIDQKWQEDFGGKYNYKISDTQPSPDDIQIERALPPSGILTLPEAVTLATSYNRQYQTEKELLYTVALDLILIRHQFEPSFFGKAKGGYAKAGGKDIVGLGTGFDSDQAIREATENRFDPDRLLEQPTGTGFGFDQLLTSGMIISSEIAIGWGRILAGDTAGEALASILRTTVTQPLLRGSGRKIVMENLTQAERNTLYQLRTFNRFRKTFVVSIITQYYSILQLLDRVKNAQENYKTLLGVYERAKKLANAGRLPRFELDRVHQDKLQAHDIYIQAQKEYEQALDVFKIELGLPTISKFQLDFDTLKALSKSQLIKPDFSEDEAVQTALLQRLDLANSADAVTDAQRKVIVAADGLRAGLNIVAKAAIPPQNLTSDAKHFTDRFETFLELDLPLDRVAEQNVFRKTLIALTRWQRDYEQAADTVTLEVRQAWRDLTEAAERYHVQIESLTLARERFDNTLLLLQYGRASSRRVLNAQRNLFDAQNAATEAIVGYTIATLNFYRDTGILQVRSDGMWQTAKFVDKKPLPADFPGEENSFILETIEERLETEEFNN